MAEDGVAAAVTNDLSMKRPREEDGEEEANGVSVSSIVSMETDGTKEPNSISTVIPGWFSEISPMWPGGLFSSFSFSTLITFVCLVRNLREK